MSSCGDAGVKVVIMPGNGAAADVEYCNFYAWLREKIHKETSARCILKNIPDPYKAREKIWIPFMHDQMKCDENSIIVGHSSGAVAAMRYCETYKVKGVILVSAYISDLGEPSEAVSGYFSRDWNWDAMKENCNLWIQFASKDDPLVPIAEQRQVAESLGTEFHEFTDKGHFMDDELPELFEVLKKHV
ncbi:unnamed protein product [Owenia fusiformis]|uniref:Hydrolase RBBP9 n=1 Tax=Owenia fusiformis TaxID=6347 RepID=A0A8S4N168_OWEFU|nr:unnamed protein product [Owenia fusiformis]